MVAIIMPLILRQRHTGQCLLCATQVADWLAPSIAFSTTTIRTVQPRSSFSNQASTTKNPPKLHIIRGSGAKGTKGTEANHHMPYAPWKRLPKHASTAIRQERHRLEVDHVEREAGVKRLYPVVRLKVDHEERMIGMKKLSFNSRGDSSYDKYDVFAKLVLEQLEHVFKNLGWMSRLGKMTCQAWGITSEAMLADKVEYFHKEIEEALDKAVEGKVSELSNNTFFQLRHAFVHEGIRGLQVKLRLIFQTSLVKHKFTDEDVENQKKIADLRYPSEWYPATRALQRTVHLHIGPTNSGKTYHALKRLEAAKSGIYAGPLRLLAHEVYTRMNAKGIPCALMTGEERRVPAGMKNLMSSCTVEMVPLNAPVEVAVIDEIQMLSHWQRGWAWTAAFLGVRAQEVHLCGETRTEELIRKMCTLTGDKLVVHRYKRLGPLQVENSSLRGDLGRLRKGDAMILFSRVDIHAMKKRIEAKTGKRCAVVYGSLPPETRAQQAALFNDPDNDYDFLVASDAIGMGLNLSVRRIIFERTAKHDSISWARLTVPEIKQIGGRAGRFKTSRDAVLAGPVDVTDGEPNDVQLPRQMAVTEPNVGYVTTLEQFDLQFVKKAMNDEGDSLTTSAIIPPEEVIERFASYFPPETPFSYILLRLSDISSVSSNLFSLASLRDQITVADAIQPISNMTIKDRMVFMGAPAVFQDAGALELVQEMAACVANHSSGHLLDLKTMDLDLLNCANMHDFQGGSTQYLRSAEALHKALTLYLWLSYRYGGVFTSQALAFHAKAMVEDKIDKCLAEVGDRDNKKKTSFVEYSVRQREMLEKETARARATMDEDDAQMHNNILGVNETLGEKELA